MIVHRYHGGVGCERVCFQSEATCLDLIRSLDASIPAADRNSAQKAQIFVTLMIDTRAQEPRDYLFQPSEWAAMSASGVATHFQ